METQVLANDRHEYMAGNAEGSRISKVDVYKWKVVDEPGNFRWIDKSLLSVDSTYQREKISNARVLDISREWSWVACGVLLVADRGDVPFIVIDGQHRLLGAQKRHDIRELPCMVFRMKGVQQEASGFRRVNTMRTGMDSYSKFRSMVVEGDPVAVAVRDMIQASGYSPVSNTHGDGTPFTVRCLASILGEFRKDEMTARLAWKVACQVCAGATPTNELYTGLCYLAGHMAKVLPGQSIADRQYLESLVNAGPVSIGQSINRARSYFAKGGPRVYAEGIINVLNYKKKSRRIPSTLTVSEDDDS